jgi:hypothetical protein
MKRIIIRLSATARELLNATRQISSIMRDFDAPFIVLHGLKDMVTDPRMSEMLYNESHSTDKIIKLYSGETDENIDTVFDDAISWVADRSRHLFIDGMVCVVYSVYIFCKAWGSGHSSTRGIGLPNFILIHFGFLVPLFCYAS